jgi:hypothetical protein
MMSNSNKLPWIPLLAAAVFFSAAAYAMFEALSQAGTSGLVELYRYRRRPPQVVPWRDAWAYFLGLTLILSASLMLAISAFKWKDLYLVAAAMLLVGAFLIIYAGHLISTIIFLALLVATFVMGRKFGFPAALLFFGAGAGVMAIIFYRG